MKKRRNKKLGLPFEELRINRFHNAYTHTHTLCSQYTAAQVFDQDPCTDQINQECVRRKEWKVESN